ncbi:unnamed protein product [Dibothriocephalus latus]|uniref:HYDIN/VesB/CFA65-like Ig-like domain-containing protein n=1 Tax=Dibothriocephalus latus TaxID=60516 RepID=A0A3P6TD89_DIBLA|nr:unnamed protein product [Dibothriocephalus latus]
MQPYGKRILSLSETFNFPDACQVDIPIFSTNPPAIYAADFKPQAKYVFDIEFRNQDKVPRSVRVDQNDSAYFKIIGRTRSFTKIATGLSAHVRIQFSPEELKDYTHELVCTTDREVFSIPIYCIGRRSSLEGPKSITFVNCPVKQTLEKAISLRNTGESAFEFIAHTFGSLSAYPHKGVIDAGCSFQLLLQYTPKEVGPQCENIYFEAERGDGLCTLARTEAFEVPVTLSESELTQMQTLIGTKCSRSVFIENRSEYSLKFRWTFGKSHKTNKSTRSIDSSPENDDCMSADMSTSDGDELNASYHMKSSRSATLSIEDGAFMIEPSHGEVMFGTRREIRIIFSPTYAKAHSALALCDIEGRQQALPLQLEGQGMGPLVKFSFRSLDVGQIFISARHTYELVVANSCEIDAIFSVKAQASSGFSDCFSFSHDEGLISPQDYQAVDITFCSPDRLGKFNESFEFLFDGSPDPEIITIKGEVVGPTLYFKGKELNFGLVSYGFPLTKGIKLYNNSTVPVNFKLRTVEYDELDEDLRHADSEDGDSGCALNSNRQTTSATLQNIEFDVKPSCGHMDAFSSTEMEITFKPMLAGRLKWKLLVDAEHVTGATYLSVSAE